jgi:hypothetical protein
MSKSASKTKTSPSRAKPVRDPATENYFGRYITMILKAQDAESTIGDQASFEINALIQAWVKEYARVISDIMDASGKRTVSRKHVEQTSILIFGPEMGATANAEGGRMAYNKWKQNKPEKGAKGSAKAAPNRAEKYAEIHLSVSRIKHFLVMGLGMGKVSGTSKGKQGKHERRLAPAATIYLTGVLENVLGTILGSAAGFAKASKKARIVPRHIKLAILADNDLAAAVANSRLVLSGGVAPAIHKVLLPAKSAKSAKTQAAQ